MEGWKPTNLKDSNENQLTPQNRLPTQPRNAFENEDCLLLQAMNSSASTAIHQVLYFYDHKA
ncbi:hypothetical protein Ahy_A08g037740 isoform D [Arachis hypogaea]|uniref:Uncharacterized protein n=1 Tax=Arachis hypogaea TaxID=3818 RepID=A0A445BRR2_ARAHY|nr:hypothetical protein Ahy_A08g037740 isoform D [Arachis hypogaea]